MTKTSIAILGLMSAAALAQAADYTLHTFKKIQLTDQFWCEGAYLGDFNRDGKKDVVGGPFWWAGPDFKTRHAYRAVTVYGPGFKTSECIPAAKVISTSKKSDGAETSFPGFKGAMGFENAYSDAFLTYVYDLNRDGWDDILVYGVPSKPAIWFENPKGKKAEDGTEYWVQHTAIEVLDNESPTFGDLTGDGRPEIICNSGGFLGYASPDWSDVRKLWTWHSISPKGTWHKYTHGIGFGDVNGDKRPDFLEAEGWWEYPPSLAGDPVWKNHPFAFAPKTGAAQIYAYDFNGDGRNDILTALAPHGYGLAWYEQVEANGEITFKQCLIMGSEPKDNKYGVKFSQVHAIDLVDMDGDGVKDIITGKRFWAHGPGKDEEPNAPAVLYWFKTMRNKDKTVDFIPYLIDDDSGVGTQVLAADVNGDKRPDVIVGNKKGVFVFLHEVKKASKAEWAQAQPKPFQP